MKHHVMPIRTNVEIFIILLVLLFATIGANFMPLGVLHFPVAMLFATIKAVLIFMFFMHLKYSHRYNKVVVVASFLFLGILLVFFMNDYVSRGWFRGYTDYLPVSGVATRPTESTSTGAHLTRPEA